MERLKIAIDPHLLAQHGPEIHWVWRLLLSSIGWAWQEVPLTSPCHIAYVRDPAQAPEAKFCIQADFDGWLKPATHRLNRVKQWNGLSHPVYNGREAGAHPLRAAVHRVVCTRDLIFDVFWLVTGQEESHWTKDQHGFVDLAGTTALHEQLPRLALVSQIACWLEKTVKELGHVDPLPRWPGGKRAAGAVGHDVDYPEVKRLIEPLRIVARQGSQGFKPALEVLIGQRSYWQFPAWVEFEKQLQTRSAFYFVPRQGSLFEYATGTPDPFYDVTAPQFRDLFHYLIDEGFEVGIHASYLAYQSREKFAAEKERLEAASGHPVVGNRHHYWHLNPDDVEETLLIHEQIGLKYDASLFHNRYLGWRRSLSWPFFPFHQSQRRELQTLQIPTGWMDDQLFGMQGDNQGDRFELLKLLADRTAQQRGCFLIDVHDYVLDDVLFPQWAATYHRIWTYLLERGDFWFATPAQVAEHWTQRYQSLAQASLGLAEGRV